MKHWSRVLLHIQGAFVLLQLMLILFMALPAPGPALKKLNSEASPTLKDELEVWVSTLKSHGVKTDVDRLRANIYQFGLRYQKALDLSLQPFEGYLNLTTGRQSWRMFSGPIRYPTKLRVEIYESASWRTVYLARDATSDWRAGQFDFHRMRKLVLLATKDHENAGYQRLVEWIRRQARKDFGQATRVRIALLRSRTRGPDEEHPVESTVEQERLFRLRPEI